MGCCFWKNTPSPSHPPPVPQQLPVSESDISVVKAPLPPLMEEETVKEVLSEIRKPKPPSFPKMGEEKTPTLLLPSLPIIDEQKKVPINVMEEEEKKVPISVAEEISDFSEICSLSESISTTTITERKEEEISRDDGEVQQRVIRSPAKIPRKRSIPSEFASRTDRGGKSPARRPEPSPGRRNDNAVKSAASSTEVGQAGRRRIAARPDQGESSGRRSRSPATRTGKPDVGRSPSRRAVQSPGRIPAMTSENNRRLEENNEENRSANESLENPLVSLECFIFI